GHAAGFRRAGLWSGGPQPGADGRGERAEHAGRVFHADHGTWPRTRANVHGVSRCLRVVRGIHVHDSRVVVREHHASFHDSARTAAGRPVCPVFTVGDRTE